MYLSIVSSIISVKWVRLDSVRKKLRLTQIPFKRYPITTTLQTISTTHSVKYAHLSEVVSNHSPDGKKLTLTSLYIRYCFKCGSLLGNILKFRIWGTQQNTNLQILVHDLLKLVKRLRVRRVREDGDVLHPNLFERCLITTPAWTDFHRTSIKMVL